MNNGTPLYNLNYVSCITSNIYFKVLAVMVFGLMITFVDEIEVLQDKRTLLLLLFVVLLFSWTHIEELGAVILLIILLVLVYNVQHNKKKQTKL
jgi:chromate transport protein ChrA